METIEFRETRQQGTGLDVNVDVLEETGLGTDARRTSEVKTRASTYKREDKCHFYTE
jgi:hypothetical protein